MLELRNVTRLYGDQAGAKDVSFTAPTGARTVIVGPSGSGKTTLLRLIAGFEALDAGSIILGGRVLATDESAMPPHRRRIAYLPQEGALFPHMSVADNVGFAIARNAPGRQELIDDLLSRVGLSPAMRDRRPHQLSGGQQQRVALARALAQQPDLMLLDEPFSALDTGLRDAMRNMVGEVLGASGITSLLVTHDQSEALAFADHLVVMREGRVADFGAPQRLYRQPKDAETARFLGTAIILPARIASGLASTAIGTFPIEAADAAGASLLIRPEQLIVSDTAADIRAVVRQATFCGSHWEAEVDLQRGLGPTIPAVISLPATHQVRAGQALHLHLSGRPHLLQTPQ